MRYFFFSRNGENQVFITDRFPQEEPRYLFWVEDIFETIAAEALKRGRFDLPESYKPNKKIEFIVKNTEIGLDYINCIGPLAIYSHLGKYERLEAEKKLAFGYYLSLNKEKDFFDLKEKAYLIALPIEQKRLVVPSFV